jgi:hypothetical protein
MALSAKQEMIKAFLADFEKKIDCLQEFRAKLRS